MIGAEVLVASAVSQHVIGGRQNGGRHGDNRLFRAAACLEPQELSFKVAALLRGAAQAA
jgi:hypothetical protein